MSEPPDLPVPSATENVPVLGADEVIVALLRGILGQVPGYSFVAEFVGLGVVVAGRLDRMRQGAQEMSAAAGSEEGLVEALRRSETLEVLAIEALEAASRTAMEDKRILLGRVVGRAVLDDARIDEAQLITAALADLDAPHVRALERLRRAEHEAEEEARRQADEAKAAEVDADKTLQAWNDRYRQVIDEAVISVSAEEALPVLWALIRHGLVVQTSTWAEDILARRVSEFGRGLLDELHRCSS